jgi:predicted  nucleic acid-binding Zn-ribbon protein
VPNTTGTAMSDSDDLDRVRAERDAAIAHARALEMQLGELRGQVKRLELIMWRRTARRRLWRSRLDRVLAKVRRS